MRGIYAGLVFIGLTAGTQLFAGDSSSGCGLGWQILTKNSLLSSFSRSLTHAILPNSFSMTFGTSGCAQHSIVKNERKAEHFVAANYTEIQNELAIGPRHYVAALANTFGCSSTSYEAFGEVLRQNYDAVYPVAPLSAGEVVTNLKTVLFAHPDLAMQCGATS